VFRFLKAHCCTTIVVIPRYLAVYRASLVSKTSLEGSWVRLRSRGTLLQAWSYRMSDDVVCTPPYLDEGLATGTEKPNSLPNSLRSISQGEGCSTNIHFSFPPLLIIPLFPPFPLFPSTPSVSPLSFPFVPPCGLRSDGSAMPRQTSTFGDRSFAAAGPRKWNELPSSLRDTELSLTTFNEHLKTYLFSTAF